MKISIIIPTRERLQFLRHSLATVLALEDQDVEIIVSDNESSDGTRAYLDGLDDRRLRVVGTGRRVSMRQNFEYALSHATGDYLIFFGDDDALLPGQFPALRSILEREQPDCLTWSEIRYWWPRVEAGRRYGTIRFEQKRLFGPVCHINADDRRASILCKSESAHGSSPTLYHGAVARRCLDALCRPDCDFFSGKVPDVYFTLLAMLCGITQLHCEHPFTIHGTSDASNGASYGRKSVQAGPNPHQLVDPARLYLKEAATDPVQDPYPIGFGVPAAVLETLEAALPVARALVPGAVFQPDYAAWYRYVLTNSTHLPPEEVARIRANLSAHAQATGNLTALHRALTTADRALPLHKLAPARLRARWNRLLEKAHSFRASAQSGDQNTVQTAAELVDRVLGAGMVVALEGKSDPDRLWRQVRARAKMRGQKAAH